VQAVALGIIDADSRKDIDAVLRLYGPTTVLGAPDGSTESDSAARGLRYDQLFRRYDPELVTYIDEVMVSGSLGFVRGHITGRFRARDSGTDRVVDDRYWMILRRDDAHGWRITHLTWQPRTETPLAGTSR
jgi:ketosteroid isomerase-like protein